MVRLFTAMSTHTTTPIKTSRTMTPSAVQIQLPPSRSHHHDASVLLGGATVSTRDGRHRLRCQLDTAHRPAAGGRWQVAESNVPAWETRWSAMGICLPTRSRTPPVVDQQVGALSVIPDCCAIAGAVLNSWVV